MKKKIFVTLICVSLLMLIGCSQAKTEAEPTETAETEHEGSSIPKSEIVEVVEKLGATPEPTVDTLATAELNMEAFQADEEKDHKFGDVGYVAEYRDIRETTKLHSDSTEDVWEYLNKDGTIKTDIVDNLWEYGMESYTGRWAYPSVLECEATKDFYLYDWTDSFCSYIADADENNNAILICTGYDVFNTYTDSDSGAEFTFEKFKTLQSNGEDLDVYSVSADENSVTYLYKLGGFSVIVEFSGEEDTESLLQEVVDNIRLTGEE